MTIQTINKVGKFSLFAHRSHSKPALREADLSTVYSIITSGKYGGSDLAGIVSTLRAETEPKQQAEIKALLPVFSVSACYDETATKKGADQPLQHSQIFGFDFDHLSPHDFNRLRVAFTVNRYSALVFTSPRGEGLKRYVHVTGADASNHKAVYYALMLAHWALWKALADEMCVDISRLTCLPADAGAYLNENPTSHEAEQLLRQYPDAEAKMRFISQQFKKGGNPNLIPVDVVGWKIDPPKAAKKVEKKPTTSPIKINGNNTAQVVEALLNGLKETGGTVTESFDQWLKVGAALKNELGDAGFAKFDELSRQDASKYDAQECRKMWDSITPRANGANAGTLVNLGREVGIDAAPKAGKLSVQSDHRKVSQMDIRDAVKQLYSIYFDEDAGQYYYGEIGDLNPFNFVPFTAKGNFLNELLGDLEGLNIFISKGKLEETLFNKLSFTPIKYLPMQLDWLAAHYDGADHLSRIIESVTTEDNALFAVQFKKWIVNVVAQVYDDSPVARNDAAFVLTGAQGIGKTGFFEMLIWARKWFVSNTTFNFNNKEHHLSMTNKVLILLDEMSVFSKNDIKDLKGVFSETVISVDKKFQETRDYKRTASFCGCSNNSDFLRDDTGDRRFLVFQMLSYDRGLYNSVDKAQLWGQLASLYKEGFDYRFSAEEIAATVARNLGQYTMHKPEDSFISEVLEVTGNAADYLTNAELEKLLAGYQNEHHLRGVLAVATVRAKLALAGATVGQVRKIAGKTVRGYSGVCRAGSAASTVPTAVIPEDLFG